MIRPRRRRTAPARVVVACFPSSRRRAHPSDAAAPRHQGGTGSGMSLAQDDVDGPITLIPGARLEDVLRRRTELFQALLEAQREVGEGLVVVDGERPLYVN